eukprot:symbB.v1.2.005774.t1/scaffold289.1/size287290/19
MTQGVAILRRATMDSHPVLLATTKEVAINSSKCSSNSNSRVGEMEGPKASSILTGVFISLLGAFIGGLCLFFSFELVDFLQLCYILLFGGVLALMDTPCFKTMKTVKDHREYFSKYVNILTRVTGKGIAFLFLGCSLFSTMWDNLESSGLKFLAFVLCIIPIIVGIAALVIGFIKSQKLNKIRAMFAQEDESMAEIYNQNARTYGGPHGGLTMLEFTELCYKRMQYRWEDADLKLIFNALVSNPAWRTNVTNFTSYGPQMVEMAKIPKEDLVAWVNGGIVWL